MENDPSLFLNSSNSSSESINHTNVDGFFLQCNEEKGMLQNERSNTNAACCAVLPNNLEIEFDSKIGITPNNGIQKYRQLVYEYYSKAEDFESKCTMLHRNLQEMKEAWERTKVLKDQALKEKENMTLKFAKGEKKMLLERDMKEKAEKKCEQLSREIESLQQKLQIKNQEKTRISSMYDNKIHELKDIQSEKNRTLNENIILKNELKLCQIALKNQAELYRKAQNTIENLDGKIEHFSEAKKDGAASLENLQLKLEEVELERYEKDQQLQNLQISFDELSSKLHTLQTKTFRHEEKLKQEDLSDNKVNTPNISESGSTSEELEQLNLLEMKNKDLENDIQSCRVKETETLLFNKQLSEKNVELQLENINSQNTIKELTDDTNHLNKQCKRMKENIEGLIKQYTVEKETNNCEKMKMLSEFESQKINLTELNRQNLKLKQQLFDQQEEFLIMRKKHDVSVRELKREIKMGKYSDDGICLSKSSSYVSTISKGTELSNNHVYIEDTLNQNVLIERIIQLQKISVRKSEKIDFLEDHIQSLLLELRKKDRLLQFYFLQEQTETLISNEMSNAKVSLSKLGGVMASLYDARIADENLTFELLLEINCKLQAVLEDVILKNIILKGSIEILGEEIEKLNKQSK